MFGKIEKEVKVSNIYVKTKELINTTKTDNIINPELFKLITNNNQTDQIVDIDHIHHILFHL